MVETGYETRKKKDHAEIIRTLKENLKSWHASCYRSRNFALQSVKKQSHLLHCLKMDIHMFIVHISELI